MPKRTPLDKARATLGQLTPDALKDLRDEIDNLITLYEEGGVPSGWGYFELKIIRKKYKNPITGEEDSRLYGPYLYLRRHVLDAEGKWRLRTVGYYGKMGAYLDDDQQRELLRIHNEEGQEAAMAYLERVNPAPHERMPQLQPDRQFSPLRDNRQPRRRLSPKKQRPKKK